MRTLQTIALAVPLIVGCGEEASDHLYTGTAEGTAVQVPALTGGRIDEIRVDTGQQISAGDTIAVIDTRELSLQAVQLDAAGDELAIQLEIAAAQLDKAESDLNLVTRRYERTKRLVDNNTLPVQNLDDLTNQLQAARTAHQTTQQGLRTIEAREKQLNAQKQSVIKKINDAVITAPRAGIIASTYYEAGEAIPPMAPVIEIIALQEVDIRIYVSETRLAGISYGQEAAVLVDGIAQELRGSISWISPKAEFTPKTILTPETRTSLVYAVNIRLANPDGTVKHGMPVMVRLQ